LEVAEREEEGEGSLWIGGLGLLTGSLFLAPLMTSALELRLDGLASFVTSVKDEVPVVTTELQLAIMLSFLVEVLEVDETSSSDLRSATRLR